ncbi:MAG: hypothetical protein NTV51_10605 [Verrucomicrobia bacterium]|nr:hypothetical protein [Verrucomicrobiota bacterium]
MNEITPITAAQVPREWIDVRRALIHGKGHALRAGGEGRATIEIKSISLKEELATHDPLRLNQWLTLALRAEPPRSRPRPTGTPCSNCCRNRYPHEK